MAELWRDPYLWAALGALFLGMAAAQGGRWVAASRAAAARGRSARALVFASLAVLAAAALLVFPPKASLLDAWLWIWAAACLAAGVLAGLWPRAAGLPLAVLFGTSLAVLAFGLAGWLDFHGPARVATLLPFEVVRPGAAAGTEAGAAPSAGASFRGELETAEQDSAPLVQELSMQTADVALVVEGIELRGPVAFLAALARPASAGRFYRLVALVGPGSPSIVFPRPAKLFERLAAIGDAEALEPVAPPVERKALLGLFTRRRAASGSAALVALEPARFDLDEYLAPHVETAR